MRNVNDHTDTRRGLAAALALFTVMTGCATTHSASGETAEADPLEPVNRPIYLINDFLDRTVAEQTAEFYVAYTPRPVRKSISDFFDNAAYPNVILNDFLQGKGRQGMEDIGRFVVNSTFGLLGIWDMATPLGMEAHDEDFGQTLGVWGMDEGSYVVLPLFGPNSVRDSPNIGVGAVTNILFYVTNPFIVPVAILGFIDKRARAKTAIKFRDEAAVEPYLFTREAYRQHRTFLIHDGNPPDELLFDEAMTDPEADDADPSPREETGAP